MMKVIHTTYEIKISFNAKKALTSSRKEKMRSVFSNLEFKFVNGIANLKGDSIEIATDGKTTILQIKDDDYFNIQKYINDWFEIFNIDFNAKQYSLEISIKELIGDDEKDLSPLEKSEIVKDFMQIEKDSNKILSSVEYISFMDAPKELITISLRLYANGIGAKIVLILEKADDIKYYFDKLQLQLKNSVIDSIIKR